MGTAFIGGLCGSYNTNLNEFQLRHSAAGMVNLKNLAYFFYKLKDFMGSNISYYQIHANGNRNRC